MKQKMVIKVSMHNQKSRKKALSIVVGSAGVISAGLKGEDQRQIELTGDGVDVITLTELLRKKVGYAELVSVGAVGDDKKEPEKEPEEQPTVAVAVQPPYQHWTVYEDPYYPDSICTIM